jgi:hypothetical protein
MKSRSEQMNLGRAALLFLGGYSVVAVILIILARLHDDDWRSGFIMLGLSAPVTVLYFFVLLGLGRFGFESRTGMVIAGGLCAAFPAFCGFFPVYFFRLKYAVLLILAQIGLLFVVIALVSSVDLRWFRLFRR